ncbi:MAG: hypothetical protein JSW68_12870, partial [Burkholderiales bacterium]
GAGLGAAAASWLIERSALRALRDRWFEPRAALGMTLLITWVLVQAYPQPMLMATGRVLQPLALLANDAPGASLSFAARHFVLVEALGVAAASTAAALILLDIARPTAPRVLLVLATLGAAIGVKSLATAWLLGEAETLHWLSSGAQGGLVFAALAIAASSVMAPTRRLTAALIALLVALALANFAPENAYYQVMLGRWDQGPWINFNRLLSAAAVAWPFVALVHLLDRRRGARS